MKGRVLIVDDEPLNRKLIKAALSEERYDIEEASDGSIALEQIKENPPDIILLDVMMPKLNGWELTKILKRNPKTMHIPIILITALDNISDKLKGLGLGADEYLGKPIDYMELRALVKSLLNLKIDIDENTTVCGHEDGPLKPDKPSPCPSILLVEDDEKDVKLVENYLPKESYHITWTDTGESALEIAEGKDVDLILLDILLPSMNGFKVLERLKQMESARNIPVVVVSVLEDKINRIKAIDLGANAYLNKPIHKEEFKVRIRNLTMKDSFGSYPGGAYGDVTISD